MDYVTLEVHNEFEKRIEAENKRQDARISELEATVKEIQRLTINVEKLATNVGVMAEELKKQGQRLSEIEQKPGKRWDMAVGAVITGIIGILIGLVSAGIIK